MYKNLIVYCGLLAIFAVPALSFGQETGAAFDKSKLPVESDIIQDFVPPDWVLETQVTGDLNNDKVADVALKIVQAKPAGQSEDESSERQRVLMILLKNKSGKFLRAATAEKVLQCTACGGAFYGVSDAEANVTIEKGVLIIQQDHGSREVTNQTMRFRYDAATKKFVLIGLDVSNNDRLSASTVAESTNFSTGKKVTTTFSTNERTKKETVTKKTTTVSKKRLSIEDVNHEDFN